MTMRPAYGNILINEKTSSGISENRPVKIKDRFSAPELTGGNMEHSRLYELLELPDEVIQELNAYAGTKKDRFRISREDLINDKEIVEKLDKMISDHVGEDPDGIKTLWEDLNIAILSFGEYQKKGIPVSIFTDTMKFCTRFLSEHHKTYGCYRFPWGWWFPRQLSLREFRIGALEYEYEKEECIQIHIPSDADLSPQSVQSSLSLFQDFCRQYYPLWENLEMRCESWLLSPALKNILPDGSNILAFQKLFDITETDYGSTAVLDWVFPGFHDISENLPENTSLQASMKRYLLEGKKIGWSKGILRE